MGPAGLLGDGGRLVLGRPVAPLCASLNQAGAASVPAGVGFIPQDRTVEGLIAELDLAVVGGIAVLAHALATIDQLSQGRLVLGLGAGSLVTMVTGME